MKTLRFEGGSDDLFGEYNVTMEEECNDGCRRPIVFEVKADGKSIYVIGRYSTCGQGTWGIEVAPADEDNLPDWTMRMSFKGYSSILEIDVPDDVSVEYVKQG